MLTVVYLLVWWWKAWDFLDYMMDYVMDFDFWIYGFTLDIWCYGWFMLHLWWFSSIFMRAWLVGCLASYILMKWLWKYFIGWHGRPIFCCCVLFQHSLQYLLVWDYYSQLVMLWVILLVITFYIFFTDLTWFIRNDEKKSAMIRLDWWKEMLFFLRLLFM